MRIRAISKGKLTLFLTAICAGILASSNNAEAIGSWLSPSGGATLAMGHKHELGQVLPGIPADNNDSAQYADMMISLSLGDSRHVIVTGHDYLITRSRDSFGPFPGPATFALTGMGRPIDSGAQGPYDYALAKYVADLSGLIIIPARPGTYGLPGPRSFAASGSVPDGGATVMTFGAALGILGAVRRYLLT